MTTHNPIQPFHVIPGAVVKDILNGLRHATIDMVAQTYLTHERGETVNPDSYFLRFPAQPANRIIALPATSPSPGSSGLPAIPTTSSRASLVLRRY